MNSNLHKSIRFVRSVAASSCVALAIATAAAQNTPARKKLPLFSAVSEGIFLDDARAMAEKGRSFENQDRIFEAIRVFEEISTRGAQTSPQLEHTYEFQVALVGAHLDAARLRLKYGASLGSDLKLVEQNRALAVDHLNAVPSLVVAASREARGEPDQDKFICQARKLLAEGQFLMGMSNRSVKDLRSAAQSYEKVSECDPSTRAHAREMVAYIKSVDREMSHSLMSADNIMKIVTKFVAISVPKYGSYLSQAVDLGYEFYKEKKTAPNPEVR